MWEFYGIICLVGVILRYWELVGVVLLERVSRREVEDLVGKVIGLDYLGLCRLLEGFRIYFKWDGK